MAMIETWYTQDLQHPVQVHHLHGNVFSQDNQGNLIGVNILDDGDPATLTGSVSGNVIRSDGATVAVIGVLSGNQAYIILPQAAYAVPGVVSIVIKLTGGGSTTTLCAVVANVYRSSTDTAVDPGTIIPDIQLLLDSITSAINSIPSDYDSLVKDVKAINTIINGNVFNYGVTSVSGWSEQFLVPDMAIKKDDYLTFEADFSPEVDSSTYIYLKNGSTEISHYQVNGLTTKTIAYKATADMSQFRITTNSESYTGKITAKLTINSRQTLVEENQITGKALSAEIPGYFSLQRLSPFVRGGYDYPNFNYNSYQISSRDVMTAPFPMYIRVKSGFHAKTMIIEDGAVASDSGWQTNSLYVPEGSQFVVKIERATPDTSEVADIADFLSQIIVFTDYVNPWHSIKEFVDDILIGSTINYSTGAKQTASSYYLNYLFKNPEFKFIKIHASVYDRDVAEIAFYSSEDIDSDYYLASASANQGAWIEENWCYAEVPDNCKLVCFVSRNIYNNNTPHEIEIFADSASKYDRESFLYKQPALNIFKGYKYCYHFNANRLGTAEVPLNSMLDIDFAHRLGFKAYEINARETATPGVYVCMHGNSGKIGAELVARDGTDISDISINTVTAQTFLEDYVYNTTIPELQTHVTFLDEAIAKCRQYGMFPMISWPGYQGIRDIPKWAGNDFAVIIYDQYYLGRTAFKGAFNLYKTLSDADFEELLASTEKPFIFSLTSTEVSSMTKAQKLARIQACHQNNSIIGAAGVYQTASQNMELFKLGIDYLASGWEVEDFTDGNLASVISGSDFSAFTHDGTASAGTLSLADEGELSFTPASGADVYLAKASLKIRFSGTLVFNFGEYIDDESITSDGSEDIILTTAFYKDNPGFSVTADGAVSVFDCVYDVSAC